MTTQTSNRKRRCSFHNTVFVKEIPTHRTYSASERHLSWYTDEDICCFKNKLVMEYLMKLSSKKTKRSKDCSSNEEVASPKKLRRDTHVSPNHDSAFESLLLPSSSTRTLPFFRSSHKAATWNIGVVGQANANQQDRTMVYPSKQRSSNASATTMREKQIQSIQERLKHQFTTIVPTQLVPQHKMNNPPRSKMQHKRQRKPHYRCPPIFHPLHPLSQRTTVVGKVVENDNCTDDNRNCTDTTEILDSAIMAILRAGVKESNESWPNKNNCKGSIA